MAFRKIPIPGAFANDGPSASEPLVRQCKQKPATEQEEECY